MENSRSTLRRIENIIDKVVSEKAQADAFYLFETGLPILHNGVLGTTFTSNIGQTKRFYSDKELGLLNSDKSKVNLQPIVDDLISSADLNLDYQHEVLDELVYRTEAGRLEFCKTHLDNLTALSELTPQECWVAYRLLEISTDTYTPPVLDKDHTPSQIGKFASQDERRRIRKAVLAQLNRQDGRRTGEIAEELSTYIVENCRELNIVKIPSPRTIRGIIGPLLPHAASKPGRPRLQ